MKYILDEKDMESIRFSAEHKGFARAETLLRNILNGEKNVRYSFGTDEKGMHRSEPVEGLWSELITVVGIAKKRNPL